MKNNKKAKPTRAITAARAAALAGVCDAAFNAGTSRNAIIARVRATCGPKPVATLYQLVRLEVLVGYMAAAMRRVGDNREDADLISDCRLKLTKYQGFGGKAKLRKGQLGRRTKGEETAYSTARVQASGVFSAAGVKVADARGGNTSSTRKPRAGKVAAKPVTARAATPKLKAANDVVAYFQQEAKRLAALVNRNAAVTPIAVKSIVEDFSAAVAKLSK